MCAFLNLMCKMLEIHPALVGYDDEEWWSKVKSLNIKVKSQGKSELDFYFLLC